MVVVAGLPVTPYSYRVIMVIAPRLFKVKRHLEELRLRYLVSRLGIWRCQIKRV